MSDREKGMEIDQEYLADMFEHDGIEVPDSLSRNDIESMLEKADADGSGQSDAASAAGEDAAPDVPGTEGKKTVKKAVKKHTWLKPAGWAAAIAACLMLVVLPAVNARKAEAEDLITFKSYGEIYKTIDEITERARAVYRNDYFAVQEDAEVFEGSADSAVGGNSLKSAAPGMSKGSSAADDHSDTYIQVEGVDEADKVKVDGKYLYFIDASGSRILIYRADNGKAVKVSSIRADSNASYSDIFLRGDRLVAIAEHYSSDMEVTTAAEIYDISSREKPSKSAEYVQSGMPVSQRMVGDILYLVTDQYAYDKGIPYCGSDEKTDKLKAGDICCVPSPAEAEYTVIGAVDTSSGKELSHVTKAVLGGSQDIYANGENLYIAGTKYIRDKSSKQGAGAVRQYFMPIYSGRMATMIIKVRMAHGDIKILDSSIVKGTINDQFSMDERDGKFRIATTSVTDSGEQVNNLFVLDKDLEELGHVSGFARGESIKAVRYVKNKAYVITYEQTDPLFVIDLTDSRKPEIEGAVKIDGFSTLLVPLSGDRLLGIGYGTRQVESWQEISGIKFALFDISNPSKPDVVTSKTIEGVFSDAQEDHRALVMLGTGENAEFILPCWKEIENYAVDYDDDIVEDAEESGETDAEGKYYEYTDNSPRGGILTMSAADDRIDVKSFDEIQDGVERCPVIGDYIYAVTDMDDVVSVKLTK
ncbi:MAG: beta-propeller domain-containing protein [Eubacterium sp.]|nr:beta-propeller domain-containing protein [Eubacterium sp.]